MNLILIEIYQSDEYNFFFSHAVFYVKHFFLEEWLTYYIILVSSVNKHSDLIFLCHTIYKVIVISLTIYPMLHTTSL